MSKSFVMKDREPAAPPAEQRNVFVTGASGRIGSYFIQKYQDRYDFTLMVRPGVEVDEKLASLGHVVRCDLSDLAKLKSLVAGHDTMVHLAANPSAQAKWEDLLQNNIVGTYNAMVAAKSAGCRRIVYASSIHAVSGYPPEFQVQADDPANPGDVYGVSKCFGEALGRYMAEQQDLSVIVIRIGSFQSRRKAHDPRAVRLMNTFVSHQDLAQLIQLSVDDDSLQFAILHGLSHNRFNRMDITEACELINYRPEDDFTEENPALRVLRLHTRIPPHSERGGQESGLREDL